MKIINNDYVIFKLMNISLFIAANLGIHMEDPQPAIPPEKEVPDYSHEAEEYEKKLIQVIDWVGEGKKSPRL